MKTEVDPQTTSRAEAFKLWMSSPMPMVSLTKTIDVTHLLRYSKKKHMKFNMLMCWCIAKAACQQHEFFLLPEKGKLYHYDTLAINVIVSNAKGGINSCDIPFSDNLQQFNQDYLTLTKTAAEKCESSFIEESIIVGTSAVVQTELDTIVNQYTELFCNPMVMWSRYRKKFLRTTLPVTFQFHHVQMDGKQGAMFLELLQQEIAKF